jgi:hypothetical protein
VLGIYEGGPRIDVEKERVSYELFEAFGLLV